MLVFTDETSVSVTCFKSLFALAFFVLCKYYFEQRIIHKIESISLFCWIMFLWQGNSIQRQFE